MTEQYDTENMVNQLANDGLSNIRAWQPSLHAALSFPIEHFM